MARRQHSPAELVDAATAGDRGALARLLSIVERGGPAARDVARVAFPRSGSTYTIGVTGAPGSGKSTLTSALVTRMRADGLRVAVLAVDPSSPFSGGAILGDRIRMSDHALDPDVFIRSMASRGHLGGLAMATPEAVRVLDAVGVEWVVLETVGVGQVEVEVAGAADTTVVVVNPGWGDRVQANKAGLMEVADIFAINKADRSGVDDTRRDLVQMLRTAGTPERASATNETPAWSPPIIGTVATSGEGVDELWHEIAEHRRHLEDSGELATRRERRLRTELHDVVVERLRARAIDLLGADGSARLADDVVSRAIDPYAAADQLLAALEDER